MLRSFLLRIRWRRSIGGIWKAQSPEFGLVELQLDVGPRNSLRVIRAVNCPFFSAQAYPVSFASVPIIADESFYRNFTRLDDEHLWIDVCSRMLGWHESKPFEFTRIHHRARSDSPPEDGGLPEAGKPAPLSPSPTHHLCASKSLPPANATHLLPAD